MVDVLRAFGDKGSKKLIKDGERMFKGEENLIQSIGEYVSGNMKNKTMIGKVKNFLQKFWSHLKHKLNIHNEADVTRLLVEKVIEGKMPKGVLVNPLRLSIKLKQSLIRLSGSKWARVRLNIKMFLKIKN